MLSLSNQYRAFNANHETWVTNYFKWVCLVHMKGEYGWIDLYYELRYTLTPTVHFSDRNKGGHCIGISEEVPVQYFQEIYHNHRNVAAIIHRH